MNKKRSTYLTKVVMVLAFFGILSAPLYAQNSDSGGIWIGIPLSASYQFGFDELEALTQGEIPSAERAEEILNNLNLDVAVQVFFPVGSIVSLGPEVGFSTSVPAIWYAIEQDSASALVFHIPLRIAINLALIDGISIDLIGGTEFNIYGTTDVASALTEQLSDLTFHVGARLDVFGFLLTATYTLPYAVSLDTNNVANSSASQTSEWTNSITLGLGYRFKIKI